MKRKCSICGCHYRQAIAFKSGYVCENCLEYLREKKSSRRT
ncbi:MAG: hypothetical protein Q4F96_02765 [Bacillota bacterium]|nr:hypothetical protein [Bacillota bacterium]